MMAMTKAEMEADRAEYDALMARARLAIHQGLYREAVELAMSSWKHIDGMMQYKRKYEDKEFASIDAIDVVLQYAPLVFDCRSLEALESLLKDQRRIEKNTSEDLGDKLAQARALMWDAHRLWDYLERHDSIRQDDLRATFGGDQDRWRSLAVTWERMGLVRRTSEGGSYRLALVTRMDEAVPGKCSSCGTVEEAPKIRFLEERVCSNCRAGVFFVILSRMPGSGTKE